MPTITYSEAAMEAILAEMRRDPRVFLMGEDIQNFPYAPVLEEFGRERIRNTPICEGGFFGAGFGAALTGMRRSSKVRSRPSCTPRWTSLRARQRRAATCSAARRAFRS